MGKIEKRMKNMYEYAREAGDACDTIVALAFKGHKEHERQPMVKRFQARVDEMRHIVEAVVGLGEQTLDEDDEISHGEPLGRASVHSAAQKLRL